MHAPEENELAWQTARLFGFGAGRGHIHAVRHDRYGRSKAGLTDALVFALRRRVKAGRPLDRLPLSQPPHRSLLPARAVSSPPVEDTTWRGHEQAACARHDEAR